MKLLRGRLQKQVLLTLSYSQVFDKPLTSEEILLRLLSLGQVASVSLAQIHTALAELQSLHLVVQRGGFWQLTGNNQDLSSIRKRRERLSAMKLRELQPFISFCTVIPWVRGVAVTGSVSVTNAKVRDDVDVMIVTQAGRLWLTRPLLVAFAFLKGKRRSWNKEEHNSWCLNLWLEEDSLQVIPDKRSVYTAYEVCQARWLVSINNTELTFLLTNDWVETYLPKYFSQRVAEVKETKKSEGGWEWMNESLTLANSVAYKLQRWYMQRHMTTERVGVSYAFFHPRDTRRNILEEWRKLIRKRS